MAAGIVDYASLSTQFSNFTHRADLTAEFDTFLQLAETVMNRSFRTRQMIAVANPTVVGNAIALPYDYLELRNVELQGNPIIPLAFVTSEQRDLYDLQTSTGQPRLYTIIGNNIILIPSPDVAYIPNLEYYQALPTLVGNVNTTNWLMQRWPDAYLYGTLLAARLFLVVDAQTLAEWQGIYGAAIADIKREDAEGLHSGGVPRARCDVGW